MRKLLLPMIFVITVLISSPSLANAVPMTVDFSSGVYSGQTNCNLFCKYSEKGIVFTTPDVAGQGFSSNIFNGFLRFQSTNNVDQIILSTFGGQTFDVISFDQVDAGISCTVQAPLVITGSNGQVVNIPFQTLGTVILNFNGVTSVTIDPKPDSDSIFSVCIDNFVFDNMPLSVGGSFTPIDTTMVLLGATETTVSWIIPAIVAAIGIGIVLARKL